jgi:hypothetical protein
MAIQGYERSLYEARLDAQFYVAWHGRNARFFRHVRGLLAFVSLTAGTAAITLLLRQSAALAAVSGAAIAAVAILDRVIGAGDLVFQHNAAAAQYDTLLAQTQRAPVPLAEFDARLSEIGAGVTFYSVWALRATAYNDNVKAVGRDDYVMRRTPWEWFVSLLA